MEVSLRPRFAFEAKDGAYKRGEYLTSGFNVSPGAATGMAVLDADLAEQWERAGKDVTLVLHETGPDDMPGTIAARGMLTKRGDTTSAAAVIARQLGRPAVVGCEAISVDLDTRAGSWLPSRTPLVLCSVVYRFRWKCRAGSRVIPRSASDVCPEPGRGKAIPICADGDCFADARND